jgi:DNA-binding GntR family transcriptional regulator
MLLAARRQAWLEVSQLDLAFHRTVLKASGNDIVIKLWEALARHVLIVFGREVRSERAGARLVEQHARLRDLLAAGDLRRLLEEIEPHILRLRPARQDRFRSSPLLLRVWLRRGLVDQDASTPK